MVWRGVIDRYREFLPVTSDTPVITLYEGHTSLLKAVNLCRLVDDALELYLKFEGYNPTASFKDRGMTVAVSKAVETGSSIVMCASTGNTSASAAAYAAKAGIRCMVLIPEGAIALGKLSQALMHGADVVAVKGNFDQALNLARSITSNYPVTLVNSINPHRIEGQKTGAFEVCDQLGGHPPDFHAMPVGNAGNITAYWKGYKEYLAAGNISRLPVMLGFQAAGAAPIVENRVIKEPETIASAIKIGNPASWKKAVEARDESGGVIAAVTDEEILEAYSALANMEGGFVEPASGASVAGVIKLYREGYFEGTSSADGGKPKVVCILTGHGLKDPGRAIEVAGQPVVLPNEEQAILDHLGL